MAAEHRNEAKSKSTQSMLDDALGVVSRTAGLRGDGDNPAVVRHIEVPVGQRRNIGRQRRVGQVGLPLARATDRDLQSQRDAFG